jgi:hypothetical protein
MRKKLFFIISLIIFYSILSAVCFGQVQTRLRIIQASNIGSGIDPNLKDIHNQLGTLFNFTSYRLLRDERFILSMNQSVIIPVHQERVIEITLLGKGKGTAELRLKIRSEKTEILNTQVRLSSGRTVIIGGPKHGEGVTILAISANL